MLPEEKCTTLKAYIDSLQSELSKEKIKIKWLKKETEIQSTVIAQLKKLILTDQTKPACTKGHRFCAINHERYNYSRQVVKPGVIDKRVSETKLR